MEHQDWNVTVIRKNQPKPKPKGYVKPRGDVTNDEEKPFKKISQSFKVELMRHRQKLGMTHKDLAQKLNVMPAVIASYESGKVIPDGKLIHRMNLLFKTKLPKCK